MRREPSTRCPDGIVALALAIVVAGGAAWGLRAYAWRLAQAHVRIATTGTLPLKYQTLTLQRAALASGRVLPLYGSSELTCCGSPYRATELFASEPTGFGVFAVGRAGTADLFFTLTFAALGPALDGRAVVVSDSPSWFRTRRGVSPAEWQSNFLPEVAYAFVFDAPISRHLRKVGAWQMLAYRDTLRDDPLLRLSVEDVVHPTPVARVEAAALAPLGRLAIEALEAQDALRTVAIMGWKPWLTPEPPARAQSLDWPRLASLATKIAKGRDTTNPFGFTDDTFAKLQGRFAFERALALYRAGRTNRDGLILPPPTAPEAVMDGSAEWENLRLALGVLREVHARPLVWTLPLPGFYDDYTQWSAAARERYYERYDHVVEHAKVAWLDFRAHEDDRYFVADPGSHLSPRGWIVADRALDMFWHRQSLDEIRAALAALAPTPPPPMRTAVHTEEHHEG
jgi:poly-D-alanine transfer protein DltD